DVGIAGPGAFRARRVAAGRDKDGDRQRADTGRLDARADAQRARRLCRRGVRGTGATPARVAVGARSVRVPGDVRDAVLQRMEPGQPVVRPDQPHVAGCGDDGLSVPRARQLDPLVGRRAHHRVPGVRVRRAPCLDRCRAPPDQAAFGGAPLADVHHAVHRGHGADRRHHDAGLPRARRRAHGALHAEGARGRVHRRRHLRLLPVGSATRGGAGM
ncbi:MAG: hypothetical protein AVDCRST_MAG71-58, partial [uncultured Lysobacter sp.]